MKFSPYHTIATIGSLFILAYVTEFRAHALFDVTGSLWVIGLTSLFLLAVYKKDFLSFIPYSLLCLFCAPTSPQPRHASIAKTAVRTTAAVGAIGLIVGMIFMLGALSDNPAGVGAQAEQPDHRRHPPRLIAVSKEPKRSATGILV